MAKRTTSPRGGAATANGLHYQLLWSLLTATNFEIKNGSVKERLQSAQLILEPANGGDAQIETPTTREVIQLKARTTGNTWSLTEVATKVLPDLYKATTSAGENTKYVFVTEGPIGDWKNVYAFFQSLANRKVDNGILTALDKKRPSPSSTAAQKPGINDKQNAPSSTTSSTKSEKKPQEPRTARNDTAECLGPPQELRIPHRPRKTKNQ